jgi:hypothetical protein
VQNDARCIPALSAAETRFRGRCREPGVAPARASGQFAISDKDCRLMCRWRDLGRSRPSTPSTCCGGPDCGQRFSASLSEHSHSDSDTKSVKLSCSGRAASFHLPAQQYQRTYSPDSRDRENRDENHEIIVPPQSFYALQTATARCWRHSALTDSAHLAAD